MGADPSWPAPDPTQRRAPGWPPPDARDIVRDAEPAAGAPAYPPDTGSWEPAAGPTPAGAFARVRARWLPLFAVAGVVLMVVVFAIMGDEGSSELVGSLLYVPLLAWIGLSMRAGVRLRPFFAVPHIGSYWWVVLGMLVASFVFSLGASAVTSALLPGYVESAEIAVESNAVVLAFTIAVIPPVVEELVFRGFLLERWAVKWRIGISVLLQGVCFGVLHVDPVGAGMFGVVMALLYLRTGTLWVPIAVHALNNGFVLLIVLLTADGGGGDSATGGLEQIGSGLMFMAVSAPFIGVFIYRNWRGPDSLTPYERAESGPRALPPRHLGPVHVAAGKYRLRASEGALLVSRDKRGRDVVWSLPFSSVTYFGVTRDWRVVTLAGSGTARVDLDLPWRGQRARHRVAAAINERVASVSRTEAVWQ